MVKILFSLCMWRCSAFSVLLAITLDVHLIVVKLFLLLLHLHLARPLPESLQAIDIDVLRKIPLGLIVQVPQIRLFHLALFVFVAVVHIQHGRQHRGQLSLR